MADRLLSLLAFWGSLAGLVHTHVGYPLSLTAWRRLVDGTDVDGDPPTTPAVSTPGGAMSGEPPFVSLIVAAHDEEDVIARKVSNALALDYPRERLELVVASDGSGDRTVERAREAGADLVLDLPRGGKIVTQNAAVERASGKLLAFSDANAYWEPDALVRLVGAFADPGVGYACGQVAFTDAAGDNQEGAYWRYEMWVRELESELGGITAGNGGIYAVRREAYRPLAPSRSHDLSFPFELERAGWRSVYVPEARAAEKMVPSTAGEFERKRRMMRGLWDIVVADRMADPRGYQPGFAYRLFSHRILRYLSPLLHLAMVAANLRLLGRGWIYRVALAGQLAVGASVLPGAPTSRPVALARYYVLITASIALGTFDRLREGPPAAWDRSEGTR